MPIEIREIVIRAELESGGDRSGKTGPRDLHPETLAAIRAICSEELRSQLEEVKQSGAAGKFDR